MGQLSDETRMQSAIQAARMSLVSADVPVGAVVFDSDGQEIARASNERELAGDPTAHAEVLALRRAAVELGSWRLLGCTLVVTLEPCVMCAGAVVLSRVSHLIFGAFDPKAGAVGSLWNIPTDQRLNHRPAVTGGVLAAECGQLLKDFFAERRSKRSLP